MNNKGFTYLEMVCALSVIVLLVVFSIIFIKPHFFNAKKNTFIDQANEIIRAAEHKIASDGMDDDNGYPDDVFNHENGNDEHQGSVCYSLATLKEKYVTNIAKSYQGSVEICISNKCDYKTKIWLSDDNFYIDGAKDRVTKKALTNKVFGINRCGE